jgi:hypothetical protein
VAPQNISGIIRVNKRNHLIIIAGNKLRNSPSLQLGEFSFDMRHGKEDEGEIIAVDVTLCNKEFIGSKLLRNGGKDYDKKLETKSSRVHHKIDAQVT